MDFFIAHKSAVHTSGYGRAGWQVQHIAVTQQRFGAHLIKNSARINPRRHLKGNARRNIGLDESGNYINGWALCRQNQVNARGARLLRQARDQFLHFLADDHHQIGQLIDDNHHERQWPQVLNQSLIDRRIIGSTHGQNRVFDRLARRPGIFDVAVVARNIAHAECGHELVAALHLGDTPAQRVRGLFHIRDHGRQQMRNAFVHGQFQHLRVDHDQPHMLGSALVQQRQHHGVDAHRFT